MTISRSIITDCLCGQYYDFPSGFASVDEYRAHLDTLTYDELIAATECDERYPLADFIYAYS